MTLQGYLNSLSKEQQFRIAIRLTKLVIPIWEEYANQNNTSYKDTVVGLMHSVDRNLLDSTVRSVENYLNTSSLFKLIVRNTKLKSLKNKFSDPIVALQDYDWELPHPVLMAFYSINNLLNAALGKDRNSIDETVIYVVVNQAIDALESSKQFSPHEIKTIIYDKNER